MFRIKVVRWLHCAERGFVRLVKSGETFMEWAVDGNPARVYLPILGVDRRVKMKLSPQNRCEWYGYSFLRITFD